MKRSLALLLTTATLLLMGITLAHEVKKNTSQTLNHRWKQVEEWQNKDLPQSTLRELMTIQQEAIGQSGITDRVKATFVALQTMLKIDQEKADSLVADLHNKITRSETTIERIFLRFGLAETVFRNNTFRQQEPPATLTLTTLSNKELTELSKIKTIDYLTLLQRDSSWLELYATLDDYFAKRQTILLERKIPYEEQKKIVDTLLIAPNPQFLTYNVEQSDLSPTVKAIIKSYQYLSSKNDIPQQTALLRQLDRLRSMRRYFNNHTETYRQSLKSLLAQYHNLPQCVEVVSELCSPRLAESDERKTIRLLEIYISQFPDYPRIGLLKQRRDEILQGSYSVAIPQQVYPNTPFSIHITFRKIKELNLTVRRISAADTLLGLEPYYSWHIANVLKTNNIEPDTTIAFAKQLVLPFSYKEDKTTVSLQLDNGLYRCDIHTAGEKQSPLYVLVNPYSAVARAYNNLQDIQVWDFRSWQPLRDMRVEIWDEKQLEEQPERIATLKTDSYGRVEFPRSTVGTMYRVVSPNGKVSKWGYLPARNRTGGETNERKISLYTDRPAYRPGQLLRFEGIEWNPLTERTIQGNSVDIRLKDIYGKPIHQWNVTSNSFGSFAGELRLPQEIKSGDYYLQAELSESIRITIEEYKRPTLTIQMDKPICLNENQLDQEMEFQIDGTLTLTNGVGLSKAKISYFLEQWGYTPDTLTTTTDGSGLFSIRQKVKQQDATPRMWRPGLYSPKLTITATDSKGESQTSLLHLATQPRVTVKTTLPNVLLAGTSKEFPIKVNRAFPATTEIRGTYTIEQQSKQEQWKTVQTGEWKENGTLSINDDKQLKTGSYRILFRSSYFGTDSLLGSASTVIIHPQSKEMPFSDRLWSFSPTDSVDAGQPFDLWVGSSWGKVWAMIELMNDRQFISRQFVPLNKNLNKLSFIYRPEWGKSVSVNVSAFVQGIYISKQHLIEMREPDKALRIEIKTLRNKMLPGEKETWTLSLKNSQGKPVAGEVVATLYDASLEQINSLKWDFKPFFRHQQPYLPHVLFTNYFNRAYHYGNTPLEQIEFPQSPISFSRDLFGINTGGGDYEKEIAMEKQTIGFATTRKSNSLVASPANSTFQSVISMDNGDKIEAKNAIPVRQNFNESAFFYSQLRSNNKGEIKLPFTLPESLTTYSLRIFAHDRTLRSGYLESTIQVEKPILIGGNLPRFVYEGDSVRIKAIVFNLSKEKKRIQTAYSLSTQSQPIGEMELNSGEQREVEFSFVVPTEADSLSLTLTASTNGFGDAERHGIPILKRSQKVRETRIFNFTKGGTFTVDKPFAQEPIGRFDLTYIGSPLYHLLEAIPSSPMPQSENLISWLNAFYINHSGQQMGQQYASKSKAKTTPEQLLTMQNRILTFQKRDGGFGWFECMPSSIMMTLFFLETTQRLGVTIGYDLPEEIKMAQVRALNFVDQELVKCYRADSIRSAQNQGTTRPFFSLQYMSVRGQFRDIPLAGATLTAHRYYFDQLVKERKEFSLAQKGLLASALFRYGRLDEAREVIRSLREYSVYTPDKGRYFANNRNPQFKNLYNVNTQTEIMEAFALNLQHTPSDRQQTTNELKEMSTWLIYQKQGMDWGNEVATINALNAILTYGIDSNSLAIQKGDWASINLPAAQLTNEENASLNYTFAPQEWDKVSNQLTIKKKTTDYSRLLVTWERQSPLEKIKPSEGDLTIRQELIGTMPLQIGAATIRLTLSAKRDLDYIVVRSPRAACMEPTSQNSGYKAGNNLWYYHEIKDQGSNLYIEHLPRGTYTIDLPVWINLAGSYQQGIPTVESLFAPEFNGVGQAKTVSVSSSLELISNR